jgi:hypothetical protein
LQSLVSNIEFILQYLLALKYGWIDKTKTYDANDDGLQLKFITYFTQSAATMLLTPSSHNPYGKDELTIDPEPAEASV